MRKYSAENVTENEQLNLDYALQMFQLRPTTLLSIPWGLTLLSGAHSLITLPPG